MEIGILIFYVSVLVLMLIGIAMTVSWGQTTFAIIFIILAVIWILGLVIPYFVIKNKRKKLKQQSPDLFKDDKTKRPKSRTIKIIVAIALAVSIGFASYKVIESYANSNSDISASSSDEVKCGYCGRRFAKNSSDAKSIARSHLCNNCRNNYKYFEDYIDK